MLRVAWFRFRATFHRSWGGYLALVLLVGLVGGLLVALASSRVLQTLLFGVSPRDGWAFGAAALAMLTLTLLAALGPALTATRANPVDALRAE